MVPILKEKKASTNSTIKKISEFEEQIYDKIEKIFTSKKED
jgi:hypothetical protein